MNSLVWQGVCIALVALLVIWNRAEIGDPKWPLIGLGLIAAIWLLLALYIIVSSLWLMFHGASSSALSITSATLAAVPVLAVATFVFAAQKVPTIYDISTDTINPPEFLLANQHRHRSHNSLSYDSANAARQKNAYPNIKPLVIDESPQAVMASVTAVIETLGWQLHGNNYGVISSNAMVIEAYTRTPLLGFVDDIVVRVTPKNTDSNPNSTFSRIDVRSVSRVGESDLGANAKRIRLFLDNLSDHLSR
ncbi:MAG: hypothetical protein ACI8VC_000251 [Candidatus Endobugula sp.]|jgi:uncharacterized protein (DUF1499 family)